MLFVGSTKNGNYAGIGRNYSENVITDNCMHLSQLVPAIAIQYVL